MRFVPLSAILALVAFPALAASEEGGSAFPAFDSSSFSSQLFWLALTFGLLYVLMSKVALPRIGSIMDERRETIERALRQAAAAQKEAEESAASQEASLGKARANAQAEIGTAQAKSAKEIEARRILVEKDLSAKLVAAEARIGETKAKAMANVDAIAGDAVTAILDQLGVKAPKADAVAKAIAEARGK